MFFRNENPQYRINRDTAALNDYHNINLEISYDNFDTINLDFAKKQRCGNDLRQQIEDDKRRKEEEKRRKNNSKQI